VYCTWQAASSSPSLLLTTPDPFQSPSSEVAGGVAAVSNALIAAIEIRE
jgi:hypothetical protein